MKLNKYDTVAMATSALENKGFNCSFRLEDSKMKCLDSEKTYTPEEMEIVEYHRFEGVSNPDDMAIVFAVECRDGKKGLVISSYGPYAELDIVNFMDKVKIKERAVAEETH